MTGCHFLNMISLHVLLPDNRFFAGPGENRNRHHALFRIHLKASFGAPDTERDRIQCFPVHAENQEFVTLPGHQINTLVRFVDLCIIDTLVFARTLSDGTDFGNKMPFPVEQLESCGWIAAMCQDVIVGNSQGRIDRSMLCHYCRAL